MPDVFALPPVVELLAQAIGAASGAVLALRKGYDVIGVSALALAAGAGGGVIRDCLLQTGPPAFLTNGTNVLVQLGSAAAIIILHPFVRRFVRHLATGFTILDALSLSLFAIVGLTKAQTCGLAWPAVVLVGIITAVGGGVLRDVLCREEPLLFRPGQFYAFAALGGCLTYILLDHLDYFTQSQTAMISAAVILLMRMGSLRYGWSTRRSSGDEPQPNHESG